MIERTCQDCQFRPEDFFVTRRQFINRLGLGFGGLSLTSLVGMGLLGAYVGRIYEEAKRRPKFIIDESLGVEASRPEGS